MEIRKELNQKLLNFTLEEYDNFFEYLYNMQRVRFLDTLNNTTYIGERPILPKYEISLVPKDHFFPARKN
jgi:hypothetical protein